VVTLTAIDATATENPLTTGKFRLTRTGATNVALPVFYTRAGTATAGSDYLNNFSATSVTIVAGQSSADITVTPINDGVIEAPETVILTLAANAAYVVGSPAAATVTIASDEKPVVTVTAIDASAGESPVNPGAFRIARTGTTNVPLPVFYTRSGTSTAGSDYLNNFSATSAIIPAGQDSITLFVIPINESTIEAPETVILTLVGNASYILGSPRVATITLTSDDKPVVMIQATDSTATEAGLTTGTFTISRTGPTTGPLSVTYTRTGTAVAGIDYLNNFSATSVTIPVGASSVAIRITPINDTAIEAPETVMLTLVASAAYLLGSPRIATITLTSDDSAAQNLLGTYTGSGTAVNSLCTASIDNGTFPFTGTLRITSQSGPSFSGSATFVSDGPINLTLAGTASGSNLSGAFTFPGPMTGTIGFTGALSGNTLTLSFSGTTHEGSNSCRLTGSLSMTR
jgi:hypothetical protein